MEVCQVCKGQLTEPHAVAVVPLYKSVDHIPHVLRYVETLSNSIPGGIDLCFVSDGSPDDSVGRLRDLARQSKIRISLLELSRNFGAGPAVHAGLSSVQHCVSVVFGSDLQEPEELFTEFAQRILSGSAEICLGQRVSRDDPFLQNFFARAYWWINRNIFGDKSPKGGFDVFGLSRKAREALVSLAELNTSLTSQLQWIGFDQAVVPYARRVRLSGESTWTFRRKLKLFADSVYGFSGIPIAGLFFAGFLGFCLVAAVSLMTLVGWIMGWMEVKGYVTIVLMLGFSQALNLIGFGILGGYVYRTFDNSKRRPKYVITSSQTLN